MQTVEVHEPPQDDRRPRPEAVATSPLRFGAALLVALTATAPAFNGVMNDRLSLPDALVRFLLAFAVLWGLLTILTLALRRTTPATHPIPDIPDRGPGAAGTDR
jgi:hypothetical protein